MGRAQLTNNAVTALAVGITASDTTFNVSAGGGNLFPSTGYFYVTLLDSGNVPEIVKVTTRSIDAFTIVRGQDGTTARAFSAGASVRLNLTAGVIGELAALPDNNTFTGNNTFSGSTSLTGGDLQGSYTGVATFSGVQTFSNPASTFAGTATNATNLTGSGAISATTTATTQAAANNSTKVATTAYADRAGADVLTQFTAVSAANNLTITLGNYQLGHRSATANSGVTGVATASGGVLTVPAGATLGMPSGVSCRCVVLGLISGGVVEPAVVYGTTGQVWDETGVVSSTAVSAAASSANVVYSTTARTNVPYRFLGYLFQTQPVAGLYSAQPTAVQPEGGAASLKQVTPAYIGAAAAGAQCTYDGSLVEIGAMQLVSGAYSAYDGSYVVQRPPPDNTLDATSNRVLAGIRFGTSTGGSTFISYIYLRARTLKNN